ncbi:MAG: hypothetical protein OXI54_02405 [Chloroflexota bacterium]|nr:hypothetical protein [Chloroflexota bacterium]
MADEPQKVIERGNLLEINWANLSAELHTPLGVVRLEFAEALAETMQVAARQYVAITGVRRVTVDGYVRATAVESVEILERPTTPFGIVNEVNLVRSSNFNPLEFEHPDMPHDDVLDAWVDNILSGKYKG